MTEIVFVYGEKRSDMTSVTGARSVPEAEFVTRIDDLLEKGIPDKVIPWSAEEPPLWVRGFRPRLIIDLGSGKGGFIRSVLLRLGQWDCLDKLERVVLVESDKALSPDGKNGVRATLVRRIRSTLLEVGKPAVRVDVVLEPIQLDKVGAGNQKVIRVLEPYYDADLIVASHVTYYFGDGSGQELVRTLCERYLSGFGRIWCVIRKRGCPIYEARARTLRTLGTDDIKPFDYAEYFESAMLPMLPGVCVHAADDKHYLSDARKVGRFDAAYLLMWREAPPAISTPEVEAVSGIMDESVPLFAERHFILGRVDANRLEK